MGPQESRLWIFLFKRSRGGQGSGTQAAGSCARS